jgi:hypothetical protein
MRTIASIAVALGVVALLVTPVFAAPGVAVEFAVGHGGYAGNIHEVHYDHGHHHGYGSHGYYGYGAYPVVRPWVGVPYVVSPPVVAYPPAYVAPRCYAPSAGFYYRGPGISVGVGF